MHVSKMGIKDIALLGLLHITALGAQMNCLFYLLQSFSMKLRHIAKPVKDDEDNYTLLDFPMKH